MMYFAWMKQIIKRIFRSLYLYIAIFFFISCMSVHMILGPTRDNHTAINGKEYKDNNKWIYSSDKKEETVLSTKSFEDLNISDTYFDTSVTIVIIVIIISIAALLIYICYVCRKIVFPTLRVEPVVVRRDMPVHFRNNRTVLGSGEHLSDENNSEN
ncbi:uncharacterized protein LOC115234528 [Formica exsecta]|uniref:uncharacterized protein LOC115234528 n=1 Tax=Formica exsecta TaxID=72781 RepID=UPI001145197E|nr:uncharacterized protein LOC115234528 [Formica exsecta]XP_029661548.1 uncharacterized protein LOC115234528 [Formica exsecta]XP_029661549.1 uncharacterized protein LOC115234528 [Formica exsecta]XP_029661550.1 uncharacterized protein LOC115234528 [Formica exsecta]